MKTLQDRASRVAVAVAATLMLSLAVAVSVGTVADNAEPVAWVDSQQSGFVSVVSGGGGLVTVSFVAQNEEQPPSPTRWGVDAVVGGDPGSSPFTGDYVAAGISNIALKIRTDVVTGAVVGVVLHGGYSGRTWFKSVNLPKSAGCWVTNAVSLNLAEGWKCGTTVNAAQNWAGDIRDVRFVGVRIVPGGRGAQVFDVDSFILVGADFASAPAMLVSLGDALEARFGTRDYTSLTAAQRALDSDKDGMSDLNEILAGTNPDDRNSVFAAQVLELAANGVKISWPCVEGGKYTVSRTADLVGGIFVALPQGYRLTATSTGTMEYTDTTTKPDGGPYFYKITKE